MTKIRSKSVKPKAQKGDFAKKKTKVGRKVKRANLTEIKVKSRRIVVPLQNQGISEDGESNREAINRVIKQLHHYAESTRLNALNRVKEMLNAKISEESFVTLVLPEVIELLFNEEKETRSVVTEVVSLMVAKFPSDAFLPVISVAVTYLCSGLTNIHKGIRKDSLVLLKAMAQKCPILLVPYLEKLLRHTLLLLTDSFQSASAPLVQQRDVLVTSGMQVQGKSASASTEAAAKKVAPTMFILILEVLASLLEYGCPKSNSNTLSEAAIVFQFNPSFASNAALLFNQFANPRSGLYSSGDDKGSLSPALIHEILEHINSVWKNLVMSSSTLSMDVLSSLQACTKILLCLSRVSSGFNLDATGKLALSTHFRSVVNTLFSHFPHTCLEATLAAPGSEKERMGNQRIAQLDVALCEIAFLYVTSLDAAAAETESVEALRTIATHYLLSILRTHVEVVSESLNGVQGEAPSEQERHATTKIFKSFELLLSKNTMNALQELLELLGKLFSALKGVKPSSRRALNYLVVPATECLCSVIDRVYCELGEDYSESLYLFLLNSLEAALSLALSCTWDQTALLDHLSIALLHIVQGKAMTCSGEEVVHALGALCETYESIWIRAAPVVSSSALIGSSSTKKVVFHNGYATCSERTQRQLLDVFMFLPFEDVFTVATQILEFLCTSPGVMLPELSHFLRLIFERRQELGPRDVVELLFTSLKQYIVYACEKNMPCPDVNTRWLAHEVSDVLLSMSSSESPSKIVFFLSDQLQELVEIVCSKCHGDNRESEVVDVSRTRGSESSVWSSMSVLILCSRLLAPWSITSRVDSASKRVAANDCGKTDAEADAVRRLVQWISTVCVDFLWRGDGVEQGAEEASSRVLRDAIAVLISMRLDELPNNSIHNKNKGVITAAHPFAVYHEIMRLIRENPATQAHSLERVLRNLHTVMQSKYFDEQVFVQGRSDLSSCMSSVSNRSIEGSGELLRNLATDILALF